MNFGVVILIAFCIVSFLTPSGTISSSLSLASTNDDEVRLKRSEELQNLPYEEQLKYWKTKLPDLIESGHVANKEYGENACSNLLDLHTKEKRNDPFYKVLFDYKCTSFTKISTLHNYHSTKDGLPRELHGHCTLLNRSYLGLSAMELIKVAGLDIHIPNFTEKYKSLDKSISESQSFLLDYLKEDYYLCESLSIK